MINQIKGFLSSQQQQLKGWELPLAGLLLTAGVAITVATLKTTASQHQQQAVNSIAVPTQLETAEPAVVESPVTPSTLTDEPPVQEPAITSPVVPSPVTAELPPQEEASVSSSVVPSTIKAESPMEESTVESPAAPPTATASIPQRQQPTVKSPVAVPPTMTAAVPATKDLAVESPTVAPPSIKWTRKAQESRKPSIAQVPNSESSIPDGTYLYGQSAQPGEIGKEYIVFEARQGKVVGAMYMPSSEYACFSGTLNSKQMNLMVVNPYNQTSFAHTIARAQPAQLAAVGGAINLENTYDSITYPHSVGLDGYQQISQVSDNDKQILSTCVNKYQGQVGN